MDPLTVATSFATIVGLLSNYKNESSATQLSEFIEWLRAKHHEDVAQDIERNKMLAVHLKSLLSLNHQELLLRLNSLDEVLASVASHIQTFSDLATSVRPHGALSAQAISIVKQFADSGANELWERKSINSTSYHFLSGAGQLEVQETRFIEDDLTTLVELGIFRLDYGSKGTRKFIITRQAVQLANSAN